MKHIGKQTVTFDKPPVISCACSTVGPKEAMGPLGSYFDIKLEDEQLGEDTWENAEAMMIKKTIKSLLKRSSKHPSEIQYMFAGDLEDQINATHVGIKDFNIPFYGVYGACSSMGESVGLASIFVGSGLANHVIAGASSHYCTAEKQFRFPMEYGGQRPMTQQWTVTACGYVVISKEGEGPVISAVTTGKIVDFEIKDAFNMGAAMAPAAVDTIVTHLRDTNQTPEDFDAIITGDLGNCGVDIAIDVAGQIGVNLSGVMMDCGKMMFDDEAQDTHAGASGCGCSASIFTGYWYKELIKGKYKKILLVPTGALMSACSVKQGTTIGGVAHAVCIEAR